MSQAIKDARTIQTTFNHLVEEVGELSTEINIKYGISDKKSGEDGIVGEAIDICLSALDIVYQETEGKMTEAEVLALIQKKLQKWKASADKKTKSNVPKTNPSNP